MWQHCESDNDSCGLPGRFVWCSPLCSTRITSTVFVFSIPQASHTKGLPSTIQCVLILQTFEGQYFIYIYAARANVMYKTTWPVVCLDVFTRETDNKNGNRTRDFPKYKHAASKVYMVTTFTMSKVRGAQLDTTAKDKSRRLTGPFLLSEPALFKSKRRLMHIAVLSQVRYRRTFTACGIARDGMWHIARLFKGFGRNLILILTQIWYTAWNNRSVDSLLTSIRGRVVSYAAM